VTPLLQVEALCVHFDVPGAGWLSPSRTLRAVDGISLTLAAGRTLGIVGESGCGKSTLARGILGLVPVTGGSVKLAGEEITRLSRGCSPARSTAIPTNSPAASASASASPGH